LPKDNENVGENHQHSSKKSWSGESEKRGNEKDEKKKKGVQRNSNSKKVGQDLHKKYMFGKGRDLKTERKRRGQSAPRPWG